GLGIRSGFIRLDSQVKYGLVAAGCAEAYLRIPPVGKGPEKVWDHAAGSLLVLEAGGQVTDLLGKPLSFLSAEGLTGHGGILASNGRLHDRLLKAVRDIDSR